MYSWVFTIQELKRMGVRTGLGITVMLKNDGTQSQGRYRSTQCGYGERKREKKGERREEGGDIEHTRLARVREEGTKEEQDECCCTMKIRGSP